MRKTSYWYENPYEAIPVMVNLKQVVMPYIELSQDNSTKKKGCHRVFKYTLI